MVTWWPLRFRWPEPFRRRTSDTEQPINRKASPIMKPSSKTIPFIAALSATLWLMPDVGAALVYQWNFKSEIGC